jgi:Xaa-Pro aminopeptidase
MENTLLFRRKCIFLHQPDSKKLVHLIYMTYNFFQNNRNSLIAAINNGVVVLSAYYQMQRGNDAAFSFEQEANFWYLTGIDSSDWWLIIDGQAKKSWLVEPEIDSVNRIFNGELSPEDAMRTSGIDTVISRSQADTLLRELAKTQDTVHTLDSYPSAKDAKHYGFIVNPAQKQMWSRLKKEFYKVCDCRLELSKLRAIKQPSEIAAIRKAISLTVDAFNDVKKKLPNLNHEYEVDAEFSHYFRNHGAQSNAYDSIVAGGENACTLHYTANNDPLKKSTLLLLDIGARVGGYAADISRTYTIGQPTARHIAVHSAVESAQQEIIGLLKPGLSVKEYHENVDVIMQLALRGLGLPRATPDGSRGYFPHAVSHGLGIDVHDSLGRPEFFKTGMVLTVEPGIYIPEEGIGVRIEDDILITDNGHENLSGSLSTSL